MRIRITILIPFLIGMMMVVGCATSKKGAITKSNPQHKKVDISTGEFFLELGAEVTVEVDYVDGKATIVKISSGFHPKKGTIAFSFGKNSGMVMLMVQNCSDMDIDYDAYIETPHGYLNTSIIGAYRGTNMVETWPDQFRVIKINNIRPKPNEEQLEKPLTQSCG